MHFSQDLLLTKSENETYKNILILPDQQFCEVKYSHPGLRIEKEKLLLAYSHDNMTAKELKFYKPRVITNSYLVKSYTYLRKPELTIGKDSWNDSKEAKYCRQLELSVFDQNRPAANSRMPASIPPVTTTASAPASSTSTTAVTASLKRTFYANCVQTYNTLSFNFVTQTKFNVNVSCNLLTTDKRQVISLLEPYFLILDK